MPSVSDAENPLRRLLSSCPLRRFIAATKRYIAVLVDRQPQTEVAKRFGYTYDSLRRLVSDFRAQCQAGQVPPFHRAEHAAARRARITNPYWCDWIEPYIEASAKVSETWS